MMSSFTTFVIIIVVAGFPWKLAMRILSECGLTLAKESYALGLSISPTPPTAAPAEFLIADSIQFNSIQFICFLLTIYK